MARELGVCRLTCERWLKAMGATPVQAPVKRDDRPNATGTSPLYISMEAAVQLCDRMLPWVADKAVREQARRTIQRAARVLRESTRNVTHVVGGTGSETPPPKPPL